MSSETVSALRLNLQDQLVGFVTGHSNGKNVLTLAPEYIANQNRLPLTLSHTAPVTFERQLQARHPYTTHHKLHPILSNLLPEGALREWLSQTMKVSRDSEYPLLGWLGGDLPGALVASPVQAQAIPSYALDNHGKFEPIAIDAPVLKPHFSLAGVQMKFSMKQQDGRYLTGDPGAPGDWIIKTPSTLHPFVPLNEYTAMSLARLAGVAIPEIKLIPMDDIDALPAINLPDERYAYGIRRYDRLAGNARVHAEDFAQVIYAYPQDKYTAASYEQIGKLIYQNSYHGQRDAAQFAIRLLVNILLANGDAHLKNWSMIYPDGVKPELSSAYDIVSTKPYISGESQFALNMAKTKDWYSVSMQHFKYWAEHAGIPWGPIRQNLQAALQAARTLWPDALRHSPMMELHQDTLREHWRNLHADFRIG
jgi:serine/threonine-protein kinase HipA